MNLSAMTDLQVAQPVFTLVLRSIFRLRATTLPAIIGRGGHSRLSRNALQTRGRIAASKKSEQTNQMMQHDSYRDHEEGELDLLRVIMSSMLVVEALRAGVGASSIG